MENNSSNLEVSKEFSCSKEDLFNAWTQPEQLKQWWKPLGNTLTDVVNDIKEGGVVKYVFENNKLTIDGRYEKVEDHNLLEYTWKWHLQAEEMEDAAYKLTVRFEGNDNNATLLVTQTGFENEEHVQPHRQGWEQGLQQLHDFLSNNKSDSSGSSAPASDAGSNTEEAAQKNMPPMNGYMETPEQAKVAGG